MTSKTKPAVDGAEITLSDSTVYSPAYRAFYVGAGGDLKVTLASGAELTFVGLSAGQIYPIEVTSFWATGASAGSIIGLR